MKNRLYVPGRFRCCSPETTPKNGVVRPDFVSGSLHPNIQTGGQKNDDVVDKTNIPATRRMHTCFVTQICVHRTFGGEKNHPEAIISGSG